MFSMFRRARTLATVAVTAGALVATVGVSPALADDACGTTLSTSPPTVYHRGCWHTDVSGSDVAYHAEAKIRIPSEPNPTGWTSCQLRIAIFVKSPGSSSYARARTVVVDCTQLYQTASEDGTIAYYVTDNFGFLPQPGYCYETLVHWLGTYAGHAMDSGIAYSAVKCGANRPGSVDTDLGSGVVDTAEAPTLAIVPTLDAD